MSFFKLEEYSQDQYSLFAQNFQDDNKSEEIYLQDESQDF